MFLKELYSYNKALCIGFLLFICAFIFINYKQGAVATPIYQFGMFSEKFHIKDTQTVFRLYVTGKPADLSECNFQQRDMLLVSPEHFKSSKEKNKNIFFQMKKMAGRIHFEKFLRDEIYTNNISDSAYFHWYKGMVSSITRKSAVNTEIFTQKFVWDTDSIKPVSMPVKISYFDTY